MGEKAPSLWMPDLGSESLHESFLLLVPTKKANSSTTFYKSPVLLLLLETNRSVSLHMQCEHQVPLNSKHAFVCYGAKTGELNITNIVGSILAD